MPKSFSPVRAEAASQEPSLKNPRRWILLGLVFAGLIAVPPASTLLSDFLMDSEASRGLDGQPGRNPVRGAFAEARQATPPEPGEFLDDALYSIWKGWESEPTGVLFGPRLEEMRRSLLESFSSPPDSVEVIHSPHPGTSGLFTLRVRTANGREGIVGVRLIRLPGPGLSWEVDHLFVISPPG